MKKILALCLVLTPLTSAAVWAESKSAGADFEVEMHKVTKDGVGESIGTVRITEHPDGVLFEPDLTNLEVGLHGFHLHEKPSCEPAKKDGKMTPAAAAGGHYDPGSAGSHDGPYDKGHKGDLPAVYVDEDGNATHAVLAPRLELGDVQDRALMLHAGGDNYSDEPEPLGGGGPRLACGVISAD